MTDQGRTGRALGLYSGTHLLVLLSALAALAFADRVFAEESQGNKDAVAFDIPAQFVPAALSDFARQARVQLFFISDGFESIRANAVVGAYSTQEALDLLLAGTGLAASYSEESGIKVSAVPTSMGPLALGSQVFAASPDAEDDRDIFERRDSRSQRIGQGRDRELDDPGRHLEEILVTGTRIKGAQSASPVITVTRREIDRAGFSTVEQIFDKLPQNFGAGASQDVVTNAYLNRRAVGGNVGNFAGGTSVNLRGLGASSTLVLLNGRRMSPSGRSASFTDVSAIPVSAIDRVEVLTDGASAIYGSDAIGGVINFVMRDDYDGAETRLRYGSDSGGDTSETVFSQSLGRAWDRGNFLFAYEYYLHDNLANVDRGFAASKDLRRFGGDDFRSDGGNPANIVAGGRIYAIPAGQDGTSLTAADFAVDANGIPTTPLNKFNDEASDLLPKQERHSAFFSLSQNFGVAELFADVRASTRDMEVAYHPSPRDIEVPEINPYFVDPTGSGLATVTVQNYSFLDDLGAGTDTGTTDAYGVVLGAEFEITEEWNAKLVGNWSRDEATLSGYNRVDLDAVAEAVTQTDPALAFNPFGDGSHTNPAVLDKLRTGRELLLRSENELRAVSVSVDGRLFDTPGGAVRVAAGVDLRQESLEALDAPISGDGDMVTAIDDSRDVTALYLELFLPLVDPDNGRPGLRRLELSLAGRHENYSDFGSSSNPKIGLVWSPVEPLVLRGTWGTSFRAPQLTDLNTASGTNRWGYLPQFYVDCCDIPFPVLIMQGANGDLKAEEATTWTLGLEWHSKGGLSIDTTFFSVEFENRIDIPFLGLPEGFEPRFSSLLNTMPTQEQILAIVNDPNYLNPAFGIPTPTEDILSGAAPVGGIMDRRINNLSRSVVSGIDTQIAYAFDTALGTFDVGLNGNYLFDFERALLSVDPLVDEVDTIGRPVDLRARGSLTWKNQDWSVSGFVNYIDGYLDNVNEQPARSIDSWTTVDLTITYNTGDGGVLGDTQLALTAQNLLGEDPPFVNNFGLAFDPTNANGVGRFLSIQATKHW